MVEGIVIYDLFHWTGKYVGETDHELLMVRIVKDEWCDFFA